MTKVTPTSDLQGKKANVKGLRSVSKAYKSNVEPMEQQKVKMVMLLAQVWYQVL